jgi:hypothetical protein
MVFLATPVTRNVKPMLDQARDHLRSVLRCSTVHSDHDT